MQAKTIKKIVILVALIVIVVVFRAFDLGQYLRLSYIKEQQASFQLLYQQHTATVIAAYMGIYILVAALSLPGAAVMTITGGALFGLGVGTVVVSFSSAIGATVACFVSRFLLRDMVQNRFGKRLDAVHRGIEREGAFYLFTLRLIPVIPFFVINLVMGLTRMRLRTFFWVSQIGMLPATIVYVNAGKEIAQIESASGILSVQLIGSFVLIGIFPITVKKLMKLYRERKGLAVKDIEG